MSIFSIILSPIDGVANIINRVKERDIADRLDADEIIKYRAYRVPYASVIGGLGLCLAALVFHLSNNGISTKSDASAALTMVAAIGSFCHARIVNRTDIICVTDKRILYKIGMFSTEIRDVMLGSIESVRVRQSFLENLLGLGSMIMKSPSGSFSVNEVIRVAKLRGFVTRKS